MDCITIDGIKFRKDKRTGYYLSSRKIRDGKRLRLHVYVWEQQYGRVPSGYVIHHINHDKNDNRLENLSIVLEPKHNSHHARLLWKSGKRPLMEKHLQDIRCMSKTWHCGEEGRKWHSEHAKIVMNTQKGLLVTLKCEYCGKDFQSPSIARSITKFCSNACKSAARRKSGIDDVERVCPVCRKHFSVNKYKRNKACSLKCASFLRFRLGQDKELCVLK